jgi:membrane protease YdiL (CAAX protease family)
MKIFSGENRVHQGIGWIIIVLLLFLRIPFTIFVTYVYPPESQLGPAIYQLGTYSLTAFLIWWERKDLSQIHIDAVCILLIILFKPIQTLVLRFWGIDNPMTFPNPVSILIWSVAIVLPIALWMGGYKPRFGQRAWAWLAAGLFIGIIMSVLVNLKAFHFNANSTGQEYVVFSAITVSTLRTSSYQLGFAAISEEPLFRGFLWGYLRRLSLRESYVWLIQALIFMSAHIYFKDALQLNFWVVVPISGLIFGYFAWRSRSIAPGMLAHAVYNAGVYVVLLGLVGIMT